MGPFFIIMLSICWSAAQYLFTIIESSHYLHLVTVGLTLKVTDIIALDTCENDVTIVKASFISDSKEHASIAP